jgi:hypothetical protein
MFIEQPKTTTHEGIKLQHNETLLARQTTPQAGVRFNHNETMLRVK